MSILELTAVELGKKIKDKEITVVEATKAALEQIKAVESDVHGYVSYDEESALKRAEEVQKGIDDGTYTGPLAGVPMAIKDNICTKGYTTTCSSKILENFVPTYSAQAVENLIKEGVVFLGKTNMDEFAMGSTTETSAYGVTKNPWDLEKVPGGSSGGSAAAVAANECFMALGYRWIYQTASILLWCYRDQTNLWNSISLRTDRLRIILGSDRTISKRCDRLCNIIRSDRISRRERFYICQIRIL